VTVRFLADDDLDADIVAGLRSREPAIEIVDVKTAGLRGTTDPVLLEIAAEQERIVVTHDRRTMVSHVRERIAAGKPNPGVFIVPQRVNIGDIVETLILVWTASRAEEWRDQVLYLPFR
jgi:predicted nuclease of predicted toxin-antitoxin system